MNFATSTNFFVIFVLSFGFIVSIPRSRDDPVTTASPVTSPTPTTAATTTTPEDIHAVLQKIIDTGERTLADGKSSLVKFQQERNYFATSLSKELDSLNKYLDYLKKEANNIDSENPFIIDFIIKAEQEVSKHVRNVDELLKLGEKGTDPTYKQLLLLVDGLVQRAYSDIGYLVLHNGKTETIEKLKEEVTLIENLESELKSIDFKVTPETAENIVQQIIDHERILQEIMFGVED